MNFNVKFSEQNGGFVAKFGEVHNISDGGYERGYAAGYENGNTDGYTKGHTDGVKDGYSEGYNEGKFLWNYAKSLANMFEYASFPVGTHIELDVPTLSSNTMNYAFRSATGVESIKLKCNKRNAPMNWHSAFSRCSDLKIVDLTEFNTTFGTTTDIFYSCSKLEEIRGEIENTTTNWTLWFASCSKLREVRFKPNSIKGAFNALGGIPLLSDESIQSVVDGLADMTGGTSYKLSLHADVMAELTKEQLATIAAKNWTVG